MRRKLVAGNWKMNMTAAQAAAHVESVVKHLQSRSSVQVAICPPYTALWKLNDLLKGTGIALGAQDVFWLPSGAFTGRISPTMLVEAGVRYVIIGHSETRGRFGKVEVPDSTLGFFAETDETVNLKLKALLFHSLCPILCVGETEAERDAGLTEQVIGRQVRRALDGVDGVELGPECLVVAYEPVWAIGTGKTCEAGEANRVCGVVRGVLGEVAGPHVAGQTRILYGGSVKAANAEELFAQPEIDGGLVGGASLDPLEFCRIVLGA